MFLAPAGATPAVATLGRRHSACRESIVGEGEEVSWTLYGTVRKEVWRASRRGFNASDGVQSEIISESDTSSRLLRCMAQASTSTSQITPVKTHILIDWLA